MIDPTNDPSRPLQKMDVIEELSPSKETSKYVLQFAQQEEAHMHTLNISCVDERAANRNSSILTHPHAVETENSTLLRLPTAPTFGSSPFGETTANILCLPEKRSAADLSTLPICSAASVTSESRLPH